MRASHQQPFDRQALSLSMEITMVLFSKKAARRAPVFAAIGIVAVLLSACSSGTGSSATGAASDSASQANPNKVYAPGVPTLNELYQASPANAAVPATGPKLAKSKSIVLVSCGQSSPGCAGPINYIAALAKQIGWKAQVIDGNQNVNGGWDAGIRQAIALKPDAIVVHGMDCDKIKEPLLEAKAAGIPVFNIEGADCNDPQNPGGPTQGLMENLQFNSQDKTAGEFYYQWGELQAAYIIDATQGKASIIQTHYIGTFGTYQYQGQNAMLKKCASCHVDTVVVWYGPDSNAGGPFVQKFSTALAQYPSANAALLNFDSSATSSGLGAAIVQDGRQNSMISVAGEGFAPALQLVQEGAGLTGDVVYSADLEAWGTVDEMNRYFNHSPLVPEGINLRIADKNHNMMPAGENYSIPASTYQPIYLKSWGIG
jgi:ribose transport system substrate-binding protein